MKNLNKSMSWYVVAAEIYKELSGYDGKTEQKLARANLISEASRVLQKSDSMIRRYLTTFDVLTDLVSEMSTGSPDFVAGIPFAAAEYIGRMARHDEDRAYGHVLAIVYGNAGVVEVRDDYKAMISMMKEGRTKFINRADGGVTLERMSKAQFNDFVADAIIPLSGIEPGDPDASIEGSFPELEMQRTLQMSDDRRGAVTGYYQMPPVMSFPLEKRFSIWAFAAQFFHQYWIVVHPLSDPEPEVEHIIRMAKRYDIGSIGVAVSLEAYDYDVMLKPDTQFVPKNLPAN